MSHGRLPPNLPQIVEAALKEDGARFDATTGFLGLSHEPASAAIVGGAAGVLAGCEVARRAFRALDPDLAFLLLAADGDRIKSGTIIAEIEGCAGAILSAERVALNFLQRMSGVATQTARFVERVEGTGVTILDTRKTTPLLRGLEKYAVTVGGGSNHRYNLTDMMLIKENHLRSAGRERVFASLQRRPDVRAEIEVDSMELLQRALTLEVDRIMLDNFTPAQVKTAVERILESGRSVEVEVSGGVTLDNVRDYAIEGVDFISIGALTHAAVWLDMSLEVAEER